MCDVVTMQVVKKALETVVMEYDIPAITLCTDETDLYVDKTRMVLNYSFPSTMIRAWKALGYCQKLDAM